jgi:hypothetical protein
MYISSKLQLFPCCYFHSPEEKFDDVVFDLNYIQLIDAINHRKYKNLVSDWNSTRCPSTCKTHCNDNKYWDKIISSEKNMSKLVATEYRDNHLNTMMIDWYIGKRCNFSCSYCADFIHDNYSAHVPFSQMKIFVDKIVARFGTNIHWNLTGGSLR